MTETYTIYTYDQDSFTFQLPFANINIIKGAPPIPEEEEENNDQNNQDNDQTEPETTPENVDDNNP